MAKIESYTPGSFCWAELATTDPAAAKQFYGDASQYTRIFEANRGKLDNPDKIQVGQELVIPS